MEKWSVEWLRKVQQKRRVLVEKDLEEGAYGVIGVEEKLNFSGNKEPFQTAAVPLVAPLRGSIQLGKECSRTEQRCNVLIDAGRGKRVV